MAFQTIEHRNRASFGGAARGEKREMTVRIDKAGRLFLSHDLVDKLKEQKQDALIFMIDLEAKRIALKPVESSRNPTAFKIYFGKRKHEPSNISLGKKADQLNPRPKPGDLLTVTQDEDLGAYVASYDLPQEQDVFAALTSEAPAEGMPTETE